MTEEKIRLLRIILNNLKLETIPNSMVSRRLTVFHGFDENQEVFRDSSFAESFEEYGNVTAGNIFTFINDHQDLWEDAYRYQLENVFTKVGKEEQSEEYKEIIARNTLQLRNPTHSTLLEDLLEKLAYIGTIPYPEYEKKVLYHLEGKEVFDDEKLVRQGLIAYADVVYQEDPITSSRMIFEEFIKNKEQYKNLGIRFRNNLGDKLKQSYGKVSRLMDAAFIASSFASGIFELKRIVRILNTIGKVSYSEEETLSFFKDYLDGNLDSILLNPPTKNLCYTTQIGKTVDYEYKTTFDNFYPNMVCDPIELDTLIRKLMNVLMRLKVVEWSKNLPIGEETIILDFLLVIQKEILNLIPENSSTLLSFKSMFVESNQNVLEAVVQHFARKLAYYYLLALRKGGIEKQILDTYKNLGSPLKGLGVQIVDIKKYYEALYPPVTWQEEFFYDFILRTASKGLSTSSKKTVVERVNLLVEDESNPVPDLGIPQKKIPSDEIFLALKRDVKFIPIQFNTPEEAQEFFERAFLNVKIALNKAWLKKILRSGFERYIESPVSRAWIKEFEDLSRELIRYTQNLKTLNRSLEINSLIVESLKVAFNTFKRFRTFDDVSKDQEVLKLYSLLPENPVLDDVTAVYNYLDNAFQLSKPIINRILERKMQVEDEEEQKTFNEER